MKPGFEPWISLAFGAIVFNPYCQILENSSRNFSKIFIFRVVTQTVYLENSSNFFSKFQIRGRELDRLPGKLIHWKIMSTYSVFSKIGSWARPFTWKTHPFDFFNKIIYDMKRLVKSIDSRDESSQFGSDLIGWFKTVRKCWLLTQIKNIEI